MVKAGVVKDDVQFDIVSQIEVKRTRFQILIEKELRSNDFLIVSKLEYCCRNISDFLTLQKKLFRRNILLIALDLPYSNFDNLDFYKNLEKYYEFSNTFATMAELDHARRKAWQKVGIEKAKTEGKYQGRKSVINKKLIEEVKYLKENKELTVREISKITGRSRSTIYKILKEELGYVSRGLEIGAKNNGI